MAVTKSFLGLFILFSVANLRSIEATASAAAATGTALASVTPLAGVVLGVALVTTVTLNYVYPPAIDALGPMMFTILNSIPKISGTVCLAAAVTTGAETAGAATVAATAVASSCSFLTPTTFPVFILAILTMLMITKN